MGTMVGVGVTEDVIGVGLVSSEQPTKKMTRSAVDTTNRPIAGLRMRLHLPRAILIPIDRPRAASSRPAMPFTAEA